MDEEQQAETSYSNLEAAEPKNASEVADASTDTAAETNEKLSLVQYLKSPDFIEIVCCFIFGILCMLTQYPGTPLNIRPIPYQVLENTGDYVINLNNNEEYVGDTVSSTYITTVYIALRSLYA